MIILIGDAVIIEKGPVFLPGFGTGVRHKYHGVNGKLLMVSPFHRVIYNYIDFNFIWLDICKHIIHYVLPAEIKVSMGDKRVLLARVDNIEEHCNATRNKINVLENKHRSNNIKIINLEEGNTETHEQLQVKVNKIIQTTGVDCNSIKAFRIGERRPPANGSTPKPRPVIATLPSEEHRNNVLRSSHKLKSLQKGIFVHDDVCQDTVLERQKQMGRFKELKTQYQTVYFRGSKLKYKGCKHSQSRPQPLAHPSTQISQQQRDQTKSQAQTPYKNLTNTSNKQGHLPVPGNITITSRRTKILPAK